MHRAAIPRLRSVRLPRRLRAPRIAAAVPSGQLLFSAEFPAGVNTYRAYRAPWNAFGGHGQARLTAGQ